MTTLLELALKTATKGELKQLKRGSAASKSATLQYLLKREKEGRS